MANAPLVVGDNVDDTLPLDTDTAVRRPCALSVGLSVGL